MKCSSDVEGDRGEETGRKAGGRCTGGREKRGQEVGFSRWQEVGEKGKNYATLRTILQSKKCKEAGTNKHRVGTGIKGYGKWEV